MIAKNIIHRAIPHLLAAPQSLFNNTQGYSWCQLHYEVDISD